MSIFPQIFPDQLNSDTQLKLSNLQHFITTELIPLELKAAESKKICQNVKKQVSRRSRELGFFQMTQKEIGGTPATLQELVLFWEAIATANLPKLGSSVFGPGAGMLANATKQLKEKYLLPVLSGESHGAFGFTEPKDMKTRTTATISQDGQYLLVTGIKSYVTGGDTADFVAVMCQLNEHDGKRKGSSLVVVPTTLAGVSIDKVFHSIDSDMPGHAYMRFNQVQVPYWSIIGKGGGKSGMNNALKQIGNVRLHMSATAVGTAIWALNYTKEHLIKPHRSGKSLSTHEGVQLRYGSLCTEVIAARSMLYRTAHLLQVKDPQAKNALIFCKLFTTETAGRVVDGCVQLCGGMSIVVGNPLEAAYKRVRQWRFAEGESDLLKLKMAKDIFQGKSHL